MLTDRQKKFAEEYLIDLNKTRAAERAGYKDPNFGRQLMAKPNVLAYVRELQEKQQKRTEITQDMVLNELAAVAFANGTDFAKIKKQGAFASIDFIPTDDLTLSKKAAIVGIKETSAGIEIKLADKLRALELIGKHIGMFGAVDRESGEENDDKGLTKAIQSSAKEMWNNDISDIQPETAESDDMVGASEDREI